MEKLQNNKAYKFLFWTFIIISILHIIYATITMRGLYEDGSFYCIRLLDNISNGLFEFVIDEEHPRKMALIITQFPMLLLGNLGINNKYLLIQIYSCTQFLFPFLALLWNFNLTKRTGRIDVLFWSIFAYGALLIPFSIFSVVESLLCGILHFILWNYLVSDIDYKKRDIFAIIFLLIIMFGTYEYVALLGLIFFMAHYHYLVNCKTSLKNQAVKVLIGLGSLGAAIYTIIFMLNISGESGEIVRFLKEAYDFLPYIFNLNTLFTIATIIFLLIFAFVKKKISLPILFIVVIIFVGLLTKMLLNQQSSVYPMWEQHLRTIPCWAFPLIFISTNIKDMIVKINETSLVNYTNLIIIVLICSIFQTFWQCVNTYYWDKNIQYMKTELQKEESFLYIPPKNESLSGFHNEELRRYIWHGAFTATSILFSNNYEQKNILMIYDEQVDAGNVIDRKALYVDNENKKFSAPFGVYIDIKNKFWDLTKVAEALNKYNKENNIETYR